MIHLAEVEVSVVILMLPSKGSPLNQVTIRMQKHLEQLTVILMVITTKGVSLIRQLEKMILFGRWI